MADRTTTRKFRKKPVVEHFWNSDRPLGPGFDRRFFAAIAVAVVIFAAGFFLLPAFAGAQTALVDDYANYPNTLQAQLPPGCDGGGLYQSQRYSLNGGPPVDDPKQLPEFQAGDVVTMTWDANTPQCDGAPVVLDVKVSQSPTFQPGEDQAAYVPYAIATLSGGPGSLSFTFPPLEEFGFGCAYQLDAIVGLPLAIVGPNGSDYSASVRGDDRRTPLIGYRNGQYVTCEAAATTTTTTPDTTVPSTSPPLTTTTAPPVSSTVPAVTEDTTPTCTPDRQVGDQSLSPATATCVLSGDTTAETSGQSAAASAGALSASTPLPKTGANGALALAGAAVILLGLTAVAVTKRRHTP